MNIKGTEKLLDKFGFFPNFHDAEVVSIKLYREDVTASIRLLVPNYIEKEYTGLVDVVLSFFNIENLRLEDFNHQKVVSSLTFEEMVERTLYSEDEVPRIHVDLDTLFGAWCKVHLLTR